MAKPDGGPAFPVTDKRQVPGSKYAQEYVYHPGMSKRDYFAGQALTGMYAGNTCTTDGDLGGYAEAAYAIADAMLAERDK